MPLPFVHERLRSRARALLVAPAVAIAGVTLAGLALPTRASAQQPTPPMQTPTPIPQVVTTGTGEVRLTPDRATVLVAVETRAATAKEAGAENARVQTATLNALQALGLPRERLSTVGFDVQPDYEYDPQGRRPPRVNGYVVRNTIRAEVRQLDLLSRVIDAALANGANRIGGVQFESSKSDEAQRQALANAVADARAQAEAMAKAAGGTLGPLLELNSQGYVRPLMEQRAEMMMARAAAGAPETPITPGELIVSATVTGRWTYR